jgi:ABC-type branched-subunit amino acid transport system substrate-binding protein
VEIDREYMRKLDRRSYLKGSGAATIVALAGCAGQDDDDDGGDGGSSDGGDGGSSDGGDGDSSDGGDGGDGSTTDGGSIEGPVTVGHIIPVGAPSEAGITNAAELMIDDLNENNDGVLGAEIEYVTADSQLSAQGASEAARQLVQQEDADFLMGPLASEWTIAAQQTVAGNEDIIYMDATAGTTVLNKRVAESPDQFGHWFTVVPRSPQVFRVAATNFENVTAPATGSNLVVVAEDLEWNKNAAAQVEQATSDDISVDSVRFAFDTEDFSTILSDAEDTGADAIIGLIAVGNGSGFISQWASNEIPMAMDGFIPAATRSTFPDQVGEEAAHSVAGNLAGAEAPITDRTLPFVEAYREKTGGAFPPTFAWFVADSLRIWSTAAESAGTLDQDTLISELESGSYTGAIGQVDFQGVDEEFPHGPRMDPTDGVWYTQRQWQYNDQDELEQVILGPEDWADHDGEQSYVLPEWV